VRDGQPLREIGQGRIGSRTKVRQNVMARIGFIGVGNMGSLMARNLVRAGHSLKVYDVSEAAVSAVVQSGAQAAASVKEAAAAVDFVITMLPAGPDVRRVCVDDGILDTAGRQTVLIDCSTIDVEASRAVHAAAAGRGLAMLDAPVSGGVGGADAATLTFMCGGDAAVFQKALPILQAMGRNIVHCGEAGFGQVTKVCNNMVAGITMLAVAEAFVMGETLGVDRQKLFDVMSTSSAGSFMLSRMCPVAGPVPAAASSNGYKPGFAAKLMLKDLRLSQAAGQMAGTATPLGAAATAAFAMHVANGHGDLDVSSIIKLIKPDIEA
jgi:3-hydroxyisobutyrate dehydrogenase